LGVKTGDRVAASLPNEAEVVAAFHGAMRLGAIWVGINRALAPPEREYILDDAGASVYLDDADALRAAIDAASPHEAVDVDPFAPAGIAYTSGTTGYPKGAVHSQYNLLLPGRMVVESRGYDTRLRKGDCFALTILNMQVLTTLLVAQCGGTSIVMDRLDATGVAEWIRQERCTRSRTTTRSPRGTWPRLPRYGPAAPTVPKRSGRRSTTSSACRSWRRTGSPKHRRSSRSTP
jgi:acyl-CoA synthetase (AMP-forming)/AMP-acid ligase II